MDEISVSAVAYRLDLGAPRQHHLYHQIYLHSKLKETRYAASELVAKTKNPLAARHGRASARHAPGKRDVTWMSRPARFALPIFLLLAIPKGQKCDIISAWVICRQAVPNGDGMSSVSSCVGRSMYGTLDTSMPMK